MKKIKLIALLVLAPISLRAGILDDVPDISPQVVTYKTVGAQELKLAIYSPSEKAASRPAILFVHGGGWGAGNPGQFAAHGRYFAARGYVAMSVQYRLTSQPDVTVFQCIADVKSCVRWIRQQAGDLGIDPQRIAVAGDSAGGHLAACTGLIEGLEEPGEDTTVSSRANLLVLYNPVIDTTLPDGWDLARLSGKPGQAVASRAKEFSPVDHVVAGAPPTLVIHGTADTVTPIEWSERFVAAMKAAGNEVEFLKLDGAKHAFVLPGWSAENFVRQAVEKTREFLGNHRDSRGRINR